MPTQFNDISGPSLSQLESSPSESPLQSDLVLTGQSPLPPDNLCRTKCNTIVLWDSERRDVFQSWYTTTPYYAYVQSPNSDPKYKSPWDNTSARRSDLWKHFDEGAETRQGRPKVICKLCGQVMAHPSYQGGTTTNLFRHLKSDTCKKKRGRADEPMSIIDSLHVKRVS